MNLIKYIKEKIVERSFSKKVGGFLKELYKSPVTEDLIHNNGRCVREGGKLFKLEHDFTDGLYLRKMIMQEGSMIFSAIHKRDHVWFLLTGHLSISTGGNVEHFVAPYIGFSKAGTQRILYAHEESIFQNVFKNPLELTDLDELEDFNYSYTKDDYTDYIRNSK
jgi:hypothetical protein